MALSSHAPSHCSIPLDIPVPLRRCAGNVLLMDDSFEEGGPQGSPLGSPHNDYLSETVAQQLDKLVEKLPRSSLSMCVHRCIYLTVCNLSLCRASYAEKLDDTPLLYLSPRLAP